MPIKATALSAAAGMKQSGHPHAVPAAVIKIYPA
jgi:hypothetical protein